jgi:hypothetical protein
MHLWARAHLLRSAFVSALALVAIAAPAALLSRERGLDMGLLTLAYLSLPLAMIAGTAAHLLRGAQSGEWQLLALTGMSPLRMASPAMLVAACAWLALSGLAQPTAHGSEADVERIWHAIPAGGDARALHGERTILAFERAEENRLIGVVLFRGEDPPLRIDSATIERRGSEARLRHAGGELVLRLQLSAPIRRLRREFLSRSPMQWLTRLPDPIAIPHLLLGLYTALCPLLLLSLAQRTGLAIRAGRAVAIASASAIALAVLGFAALRAWLALAS